MATYNLAASDLITLLNSTVTTQTGRAILESIESAFNSAFPFANTSVQTSNGPADTVPGGYKIDYSATVAAGTQLELIALPGSTSVTGATYTTVSAGTETVKTAFTINTSGGVVIGAGDQYVGLTDYNSSTTADTLIGGAYWERLVSGSGNNVLVGGTGLNSLVGGSGADTLIGGGKSHLQAGSGANVLMSSTLSTGSDDLTGSTGPDKLIAQAGNNRLVAGNGANTLVGGSGHDTLVSGGQTTFQINSGATRVVESVNGAHDTIFAGSGSDTVLLSYGTSNEAASIVGSSGELRIIDLSGSNTIVGGSGSDTVVLSSSVYSGLDTMTNSHPSQTNTSNQTITAGTGGVRVITDESGAVGSYTESQSGSAYTVKFADSGQTLTINDTTGNSVKIVFSNGSHTTV
jgi:Ca2+-binding RTX toxin-like protein